MEYRREIDGLRALAVLPVILFHAGLPGFHGGFVGVDVFFVISGYLITTIILAELDRGAFSIVSFYERRARRILPALFFVIAALLPFAWLWMTAAEAKEFGDSLVAVGLFLSNVLFWRQSGYFDTANELKVLLHTWSLAVEEQYYVFFPPVMLLLWRWGRKWIGVLMAAVVVLSFLLADWGATHRPTASFYLLPTRCWELLLGALAAWHMRGRSPVGSLRNELGAALGILLIAIACLTLDSHTPFPGRYALLPTLGATLIILCASPQVMAGRLLGNRSLVGIGLISYSAYLWHQPLFALGRIRADGEPPLVLMASLILASLVLAYFSWRFVEQPFRDRRRFGRRSIFTFAAVGTVALIALGAVVHKTQGFESRRPPNLTWDSFGQKIERVGDVCELAPMPGQPGLLGCHFGSPKGARTVVLYGDSHAQALSASLDRHFKQAGFHGIKVELKDCQVVPTIVDIKESVGTSAACQAKMQTLVAFLREQRADVVVASRWSFRLYPIAGEIMDMPSRNSEGGLEREAYRKYAVESDQGRRMDGPAKHAALQGLVRDLLSSGQRVVLVYPIPELAWNIAAQNYRYFRSHGTPLPEISIPAEDYRRRNRFVIEAFDGLASEPKLSLVRPERLFCDSVLPGRCAGQVNGQPLYLDDDHLSDAGADLVVTPIIASLNAEP